MAGRRMCRWASIVLAFNRSNCNGRRPWECCMRWRASPHHRNAAWPPEVVPEQVILATIPNPNPNPNRPQTLLPMSTANIPNKSLRKTANLRISEDGISHCILYRYSLKWNSAMHAWCQLLLSSSTDYYIFKHGFQISKHVRACRHVKLGPAMYSKAAATAPTASGCWNSRSAIPQLIWFCLHVNTM